MAIIRCWISEAGGLSSVTLSPGPSWTRKHLCSTVVGLTGDGVSRIRNGGERWRSQTLRGREPRPGEQMQGQESARVQAPVEEGRSGQEEELPPDGPSSQQRAIHQ